MVPKRERELGPLTRQRNRRCLENSHGPKGHSVKKFPRGTEHDRNRDTMHQRGALPTDITLREQSVLQLTLLVAAGGLSGILDTTT